MSIDYDTATQYQHSINTLVQENMELRRLVEAYEQALSIEQKSYCQMLENRLAQLVETNKKLREENEH